MKTQENSNYLYVSKDPVIHNEFLEKALGELAKDEKIKISILEVNNDSLPTGSLIFAPNTWQIQNLEIKKILQACYKASGAIILLKPNGNEINNLCDILGEKSLCVEDVNDLSLEVFAIQRNNNNSYTLKIKNIDDIDNAISSFIRWMKYENRPAQEIILGLKEKICQLTENNIDLCRMAQCHISTQSWKAFDKIMESSYYIISCHSFKGEGLNDGEDWYYISQYCILNGEANYDKYWAGTRVKVNGTSWYVGQGEVALHYIDFYEMENYLEGTNRPYNAYLKYVNPVSINNKTHYSDSTDFNISGSIGFEAGEKSIATGNLGFGGNFSSTISFDVADVSCQNYSSKRNMSSVKWYYDFARAHKKSAAHPQTIYGPGDLSHSTFTPTNTWIWSIPTSQRNNCNYFKSSLKVGEVSTITRYSGSQSAKHVGERNTSNTTNVYLPKPPLLACNKRELTFGKNKSTQTITVATQGPWNIEVPSNASWCKVIPNEGNGEASIVNITCEEISIESRETILLLKRGNDKLEIKVYQINSSIQ